MANAFALAALSHVIRRVLMDAAPDGDQAFLGVNGWQVSLLAPDLIKRGDADPPMLNLFLYQVSENPGWRDHDVRTHDSGGARVAAPPLALDLRYLITAYGNRDYQAEALLGHALLALHDRPILTRDYIATALALPPNSQPIDKLLAASGLAEQVELLRITPERLSGDDLSRLWSGFQLGLRPGFSIQVTVLLLSSRATARAALPVATRTITTVPLARPAIAAIQSRDGPTSPIEPGSTIVISGSDLVNDAMTLLVSGQDLAALIDRNASSYPVLLTVPLPAALPAGLFAGVQTVEIRHGVLIPDEAVARPLIGSNVDSFILRPRVTAATFAAGPPRGVFVNFAHDLGARQPVRLALDEIAAGKLTGQSFTAAVLDGNLDVAPPKDKPAPARGNLRRVWAPVAALAGTYRVRATVDGVASIPRTIATDVTVVLP